MRPRRALAVGGLVVAVVWAWFASGVRTFTRPAEVLTFLPGITVLVLTLNPRARLGRPDRNASQPRGWRSVWPWLATAAAITGWELLQLFSKPRHAHPTLSSLTDSLLSTHPSRFAGYLLWLAAGWFMVRDLRPRRRPAPVARPASHHESREPS